MDEPPAVAAQRRTWEIIRPRRARPVGREPTILGVRQRSSVSRECLLCGVLAAAVGALLVWFGPPGTDFAAHVYQRTLFLRHGFTLWDDFWYAGRYSFVDYSVLYYPLAVLLGIRVLAVATVGVGALGFAAVAAREWGPLARWSSRSFAIVWAGFPDLLSISLRTRIRACVARAVGAPVRPPVAIHRADTAHARCQPARADTPRRGTRRRRPGSPRHVPGRRRCPRSSWSWPSRWSSSCCGSFPAPASIRSLPPRRRPRLPSAPSASPARARSRALASCATSLPCTPSRSWPRISCLRGSATTWRGCAMSRAARVARVALRRWRPLPLVLGVLMLALAWNVTPLAAGLTRIGCLLPGCRLAGGRSHISTRTSDRATASRPSTPPSTGRTSTSPRPPCRWRAAGSGKTTSPQCPPLQEPVSRPPTGTGCGTSGVAYVVLTRSSLDYTSRQEARLVRSGRAGLRRVWARGPIYDLSVPRPQSIVTDPAGPPCWPSTSRASSSASRVAGPTASPSAGRPTGRRPQAASPVATGCFDCERGRPATVRIAFDVDMSSLLDAFAGATPTCPNDR